MTLSQRVREWIRQDPDVVTRGQLLAMAAADDPQLAELFARRLAFGTAGLRAALGPGPDRMNRLVVRQTTAGLMDWLPEAPRVVIGYDARHGSYDFAHDAARVIAAAGARPSSFLVRCQRQCSRMRCWRDADAGIMITASHNPPQDNGYKLYLADGIQLVAPADAEIAAAIERAAEADVEVADLDDPRIVVLDDTIVAAHVDAAVSALKGTARDVRVVYTAMHGVGGAHLCRAFEQAGFAPPFLVDQQFEPDPDFPTVDFPNPEEPGRSTSPGPGRLTSVPTWWWPTTPTPIVWRSPRQRPTATGANSPVMRSGFFSPTTCWPTRRGQIAWWPALSSLARCWRPSRRYMVSRRSPR
ncbi:MAG: hypothetical protein R2706_10975 [Acidimicrobiales bacterium]